MMLTPQLNTAYVDYWGSYNATVLNALDPMLELWGCFLPRFATVPGQGLQTIGPSGTLTYNFRLEPGSLIWGVWPYSQGGLWNITDSCLDHSLFQDPLSAAATFTTGASDASMPSPTLLARPWPVMFDGLFQLEAWGSAGSFAYFVLGVMELPKC